MWLLLSFVIYMLIYSMNVVINRFITLVISVAVAYFLTYGHQLDDRTYIQSDSAPVLDVSVDTVICDDDSLDCAIIQAAGGIAPGLIFALMKQESNHQPHLTSTAGARGYMQVMPFNAPFCGISQEDLWDREKNIACGVKILGSALIYWDRQFPDNQDKAIIHALGEYNSGRGAVETRNSIRRFPETRAYVIRVLAYWKIFTDLRVSSYPDFHPHTSALIVAEQLAGKHDISDFRFLTRTKFQFNSSDVVIAPANYVRITASDGSFTVEIADADVHLAQLSADFFTKKGI